MRAGTVAGGGFSANVWPADAGRVLPTASTCRKAQAMPSWSDPDLVHFIHRWWAWVVVAVLVVMGRKLRRAGARPGFGRLLHSGLGTQIVLGIATVMSGVAIWIAVLHQLTGALGS